MFTEVKALEKLVSQWRQIQKDMLESHGGGNTIYHQAARNEAGVFGMCAFQLENVIETLKAKTTGVEEK